MYLTTDRDPYDCLLNEYLLYVSESHKIRSTNVRLLLWALWSPYPVIPSRFEDRQDSLYELGVSPCLWEPCFHILHIVRGRLDHYWNRFFHQIFFFLAC